MTEPAIIDGRPPPNDLDAEAALISACLIGDAPVVDEIEGLVIPADAYAERHRAILEAIFATARENRPVDVVTVGTWLKDQGRIAAVGGMAYLTEILDAAPAIANAAAYAKRVRDLSLLRQAIVRMQVATARAYLGVTDVAAFLEGTEGQLAELAGSRLREGSELEAFGDIAKEAWADIQREHAADTRVTGVPTGFEAIDDFTGGLHEGDLTIIGARPGAGKTSYMMALALNGACASTELRKDGTPFGGGVAVFSLEMPRKQIVRRGLASHAAVNVRRMRTASLTQGDWTRLSETCRATHRIPLFVDDTPAITLIGVRAKCRRLMRELEKRKGPRLRVVMIDYLQLMGGSGRRGGSREQEISENSRGLKALAKELNVAIVALSQLSRASETRGDKRPVMSDLRESGAIEQDADNIQFLYRDDYYNPNSLKKGVCEVIIGKQRNGPTGTEELRFDAWCTGFRNMNTAEPRDLGAA